MNRNEKLLVGIDLSRAKGLEIGALDKPVIPPDSPGVFYVDHMDTDGLGTKYADDPSVNLHKLVQVSGVWGEKTLAEITAGAAPFDFMVASHVIEHVPDLVTWLKELGSVLTDRGEVRLAIPDRRYTFDHLRAETELADVLNAWICAARVPQTRCILDFALHFAPVDCAASWSPTFDSGTLQRRFESETAIALGRSALADGAYHDVHSWVFTPASFAKLMADLGRAGCLDFKCGTFFDTEPMTFEFFVALQKCDDRQEIVASWIAMQTAVETDAARRQERIASAAEALQRETADLRARLHTAEVEKQALRDSLSKLQASTSWRVTAPVRALVTMLRRR